MSQPLVIFDLIATVVNAGPRYVAAYRHVCSLHHFQAPDPQSILDMLGEKNLDQIMDATLPPMNDSERKLFFEQCNTTCDAFFANPEAGERLFPGVIECFDALKSKQVFIALCSGIRQEAMVAQYEYHDLGRFVDSDFIRAKTPEMQTIKRHVDLKRTLITGQIQRYTERFSEAPSSVLYAGDAVADFQTARDANIKFVGVAWTQLQKQKLQAAGCETIVTNFGDLRGVILSQLGLSQKISLGTDHDHLKNVDEKILLKS